MAFIKMKKTLILTFGILFLFSCSKDSIKNKNPYIPEYSFSIDINTNLPSYSNLKYVSNPVLITQVGIGVKGIIVMKVSDTDYRAFEANCPNQYPNECSRMTIKGINAICPCDNLEYSLFTGIGEGSYTMKPYRVQVNGTIIRVYN